MKIPLPKLLRKWRQRQVDRNLNKPTQRFGLGIWGFFARHPVLYRTVSRLGGWLLRRRAGSRGRLSAWPFASGWTRVRDLPAPSGSGGETFMHAWQKGKRP